MMTKADVTEMIYEKKRAGGVTWAQIAEMAGLQEVFVTSACLGMNSLPRENADRLASGLGLPQAAAVVLAEYPRKTFEMAVPAAKRPFNLWRRGARPSPRAAARRGCGRVALLCRARRRPLRSAR